MATYLIYTKQALTERRSNKANACDAIFDAELAEAISGSQRIHLTNFMTFILARRAGIVPKTARFRDTYLTAPQQIAKE